MATIGPEAVINKGQVSGWKWVNLTENDEGAPVSMPDKTDKTFQVTGVFGVLGEVGLQGTIDPEQEDYMPSRAFHTGTEIAIVENDRVSVIENDLYNRPNIRAGTGMTITCWLMAVEPT
jgi:hypothetical protein